MKMDRNIPGNNGGGKYALLNLRRLTQARIITPDAIIRALETLEAAGVIEWGEPHAKDEFFVVKLRDQFSQRAIRAYAFAIAQHDPEFSAEVEEMAKRAGPNSPFCKHPD